MQELAEDSCVSSTLTPQKSVNDVNFYRYVVLKNNIRALLVSSPKDVTETCGKPGETYSAEDGPEFLRTGATSRAMNLASEVFFAPSRKKNLMKTKENKTKDDAPGADSVEEVEMELEVESEEKEEEEYAKNLKQGEDEECTDEESLSGTCDDDKLDAETLSMIEDGSLLEIYEEVMSAESNEIFDSSTDVGLLTSQMIPVGLKQISEKQDDGFQLVFQEKQTPIVHNGDVSMTFPVGSLHDPSELKGISDLSRKVLEDGTILSVTSTGFPETMSTFVNLHQPNKDIESSLKKLLDRLQNPDYKQERLESLLSSKYPYSDDKYEIVNKMDSMSWLLNDKKQLQLIYSLAKNLHHFANVSPGYRQGLSSVNVEYEKIGKGLENTWGKYLKKTATVVLQSSESLDSLQHVLIKRLCTKDSIEDKSEIASPTPLLEEPFAMTTFAKVYKVAYKGGDSAIPSLVLTWALDPALWKNYKAKPLEFVAWLISHKLNGGLYSILSQRGYISDLQAGCNHTGYHRNNWCSLFQINLQLTHFGYIKIDRIVPIIMTYIRYLAGVMEIEQKENIFQYMKRCRQIMFDSNEPEVSRLRDLEVPFSHHTNSTPRVCALSEALQKFPPEDILMGEVLFYEFQPNTINGVLQSLLPDTCNYVLSSQTHENEFPRMHEEKYYKTKYIISEIPNVWVNGESTVNEKVVGEIFTGFETPRLHYFANDLHPSLEVEDKPLCVPLRENIILWHKNSSILKNMVSCMVHLGAPHLSAFSPANSVMVSMLANELNEMVMADGLDVKNGAHLHWSIQPTHFGILVNVFGLKRQALETCQMILNNMQRAMLATNPKKHNFLLRKKIISALSRAETLAKCFFNQLTIRNYVSLYSRFGQLKHITQELIDSYASRFWSETNVGILVLGASDFESSLQIANNVFPEKQSVFSPCEALTYIWPVGSKFLRILSMQMEKNEVFISHYFQLPASLENRANADLFLEFIQSSARESPPFRVNAQVNDFSGIIHFEISGSALNLPVDIADKQLDNFMQEVIEEIKTFPDIFKSVADSTAMKKWGCGSYQNAMNVIEEYGRKVKDFSFNFGEISSNAQQFENVSRNSLSDWIEKYFTRDGKERRKISIQVVAHKDAEKRVQGKRTNLQANICLENNSNNNSFFSIFTPKSSQPKANKFIDDVATFTKSCNFYNTGSHNAF